MKSILPTPPVTCWRVCAFGASGKCTHPEARHGATADSMREWGMPCGPEAALMRLPGDPQQARGEWRSGVKPA